MDACDVELLVEQYGDNLYRYCRSVTYTLEDAEDLYQQTFKTEKRKSEQKAKRITSFRKS